VVRPARLAVVTIAMSRDRSKPSDGVDRGRRTVLLVAPLLGLTVLGLRPRPARAEEDVIVLAVVTGSSNRTDRVTLDQLRRVFLGERVDDASGNRFIPINHPPKTPDRVGFDRVVLGMDPDAVGRFWVDRRIRGGAPPPRTVDSVATLVRVVDRLPGAIAYLRPSQVDAVLRVLTVEGKLPSVAGYPVTYRR
jgi:hypothetical protein